MHGLSKKSQEIFSCSKSLHTNNLRRGFILLKIIFLSLAEFFTAKSKGAWENERRFTDLNQNLEHFNE